MSWTGVRPRKLSMNINFTKPTNRDGSKLIVVQEVLPGNSPRKQDFHLHLGATKVVPEPKREKRALSIPGPALYSPRYDAVEGKRDKNVQNWLLALKAPPIKINAPNNSGIDNQILSVMSKEVKKQKERVTQEDIDREDEELISSLVPKMSPNPKHTQLETPIINAFSPRE